MDASTEHFSYTGYCQCGDTRFTITLPAHLNTFIPRQCDCHFCTQRGIAYLSDHKSDICITCPTNCTEYKQGSNQATFLACPKCDDVVAVSTMISGSLRGAVNASLLDDIRTTQQVSPKHLAKDEKMLRWNKVWGRLRFRQIP